MFLEKNPSSDDDDTPLELEIQDSDEKYGRPLAEILNDLRRPIPGHIVHSRQIAGRRQKYLSVQDTIAILDQYAPGWEGNITNLYATRDRLIVVYRLTIHAAEGNFSREAMGSSPLDGGGQGDSNSVAESAALRNAAAKFGLALYL